MNKVIHGSEARETILNGAKELYMAVKATFGPTSGNVGIMRAFGNPTVTHDGVTVAKAIELEGDLRLGAELIKEVAGKMNDTTGDGTTTVTILAYHILREAHELTMVGGNPMLLRKELEADARKVLAELPKYSIPTDNKARVAEISTISSGDAEIGSLVSEIMDKVGLEGVVTVEEGQGLTMESEIVKGFTFERGYTSPYMITDSARMEAVISKPVIVLCGERIGSQQDMMGILEKLNGRKDLVIIADDVAEEPLNLLIINKLKGILNVAVVKSPGFGDRRMDMLEDLAALTGASVLTKESKEIVFGTADKVIIGKDQTTIIGGQDVKPRVAQLTKQLATTKSTYDKETLQARRAALQGKVAVIKVGGATETEIEEKKFRVDDAVYAAKAALAEGTVPGGATTLARLGATLGEGSILGRALVMPFTILLENAGLSMPTLGEKDGVDVITGEVVDLRKAGIIDPTKTVRQAIENAVSVAGTALTMKAIVVDIPKEKDKDIE